MRKSAPGISEPFWQSRERHRTRAAKLTPTVTSANANHSFAASLILPISSTDSPSPCKLGIPIPVGVACGSLASSTWPSAPVTCVGRLPNTPPTAADAVAVADATGASSKPLHQVHRCESSSEGPADPFKPVSSPGEEGSSG